VLEILPYIQESYTVVFIESQVILREVRSGSDEVLLATAAESMPNHDPGLHLTLLLPLLGTFACSANWYAPHDASKVMRVRGNVTCIHLISAVLEKEPCVTPPQFWF
jgi:hypothetical protein